MRTSSPAAGRGAVRGAGAPPSMPQLTLQELFERLGWFVSIRWFAGVGAALLVLIGSYTFSIQIPAWPVALTIGALFTYNALFLLLVTDAYRRHHINERFVRTCANAQLLCDTVTLAFLMHFTGGVENPFIVFYVCPMVVASEVLPNRTAYAHALLGALLVNFIAWTEYAGWLPHVAVGAAFGAETYQNPLFVAKFSAAVSLLPFAIVFLGGSISSRLRRREAELEATHAELSDLEKSKSFLMRQTSHDLRAPLDALVSLLRSARLCADGAASPELQELLRRTEHRATSLTHLIDELHRYALLRDATATLVKRPLDLADLAHESVGLYEAMATEKNLRLFADLHRPAPIMGNAAALNELLSNLLSNAIQYTPPGGQVRISVQEKDDCIELAVIDDGIGIPPEALNRIFNEFYRAENARMVFRNGTGMGLPIVKRIAEAHDAALQVRSTVGRGAVFQIRFPISSADDAQSTACRLSESEPEP